MSNTTADLDRIEWAIAILNGKDGAHHFYACDAVTNSEHAMHGEVVDALELAGIDVVDELKYDIDWFECMDESEQEEYGDYEDFIESAKESNNKLIERALAKLQSMLAEASGVMAPTVKIATIENNIVTDGEAYKRRSIRLGGSDIAALTLTGITQDGITASVLHFGGDGAYEAWLVDDAATIPAHYSLVKEFSYEASFYDGTTTRLNAWLKIYDDSGLTAVIEGKKIGVYRAGDFGCLICVDGGHVEEYQDTVWELIIDAAHKCGSKTALAKALGVSLTTLQYWKSGAHAPRADKLAALRALAGK